MHCHICGKDDLSDATHCPNCGAMQAVENNEKSNITEHRVNRFEKVSIPIKRKKISLLGIVSVLFVTVLATLLLRDVIFNINKPGSVYHNAYNYGFAAGDADWNYYTQDGIIYKIKADGTQRRALTDAEVLNFTLAGEWIYYYSPIKKKICRVSTQGDNQTDIYSCEAYYLNYYDGWLYYNNKLNGELFRLKPNGTENQLIVLAGDSFTFSDDGWIYYTEKSQTGGIWKVKPDGSRKTSIIEGQFEQSLYADCWVYYEQDGSIGRVKPDGTRNEKLYTIQNACIRAINYWDGWLYFSSESDADIWEFHKMRTDGSELTHYTGIKAWYICVANEWIFYIDISTSGTYKIRPDGTGNGLV